MNNIYNYTPALRIALTSQCNLNCEYCPPKGENFFNVGKLIPIKRLLKTLTAFYEIGFRQFGFTGGEPLLNKDLNFIIRECTKFKNIFLKLYTNGSLLKRKIKILKELDIVKLSLDSVDTKKYEDITGKNKLKDVLKGIELAKKSNIKIRINTVITQKNYGNIFNLIDFCSTQQIDLKILDLNCFDIPGYLSWRSLYKSPSGIVSFLEKKGLAKRIIYTIGNYGIPMPEFRWKGIRIRIKDTNNSSTYSPICQNCKYFLCQEGLYHLTLTCDGKLKLCKHRPDIYVDLDRKPDSEIKKDILRFLNEHYSPAVRLFSQKQVFLGYFGTNGYYKTK